MRKIIIGFILFFVSILIFNFSSRVFAQTETPAKTVLLAKDQVISGDYINAGSVVDLEGTVDGDAYIAGGTVLVDGTVNGDLLVAGGNVTVRGDVLGNARVAGGNIVIDGRVEKNLSILGGSVNIADPGKIGGSIVGAGGTFTIDGSVGKDINIATGQLAIGSQVGGNVTARATQLSFMPNANIGGTLSYWSNQKASIATGAVISGKVSQYPLPENKLPEVQPVRLATALAAFSIYAKIVSFLAAFLIGFLFITFFPLYVQKLAETTKKDFWTNFGVGLIALIITPIIIILLLITLIGMPLALFIGMLFVYTLYAARIIVAIVIGEWLIKYFAKKVHILWSLFVGLLIYGLLSAIPLIGWAFSIVVIATGFGAILIERKHNYTQLRAKRVI